MMATERPPVTLYTRRWCGYCFAARRLFDRLDVRYEEIRLDRQPELRTQVSKDAGGWRTVPMIFIGDRFVGGYSEIADLHRRDELDLLVSKASREHGSDTTVGQG